MLPNVAYLLYKPLNLHRQYHQRQKQADKQKMEYQIVDSQKILSKMLLDKEATIKPGRNYVDWSDRDFLAYIRQTSCKLPMRPEENCEGTSEPELDLRPDKYRILAQFRATVYTFPLSPTKLRTKQN